MQFEAANVHAITSNASFPQIDHQIGVQCHIDWFDIIYIVLLKLSTNVKTRLILTSTDDQLLCSKYYIE